MTHSFLLLDNIDKPQRLDSIPADLDLFETHQLSSGKWQLMFRDKEGELCLVLGFGFCAKPPELVAMSRYAKYAVFKVKKTGRTQFQIVNMRDGTIPKELEHGGSEVFINSKTQSIYITPYYPNRTTIGVYREFTRDVINTVRHVPDFDFSFNLRTKDTLAMRIQPTAPSTSGAPASVQGFEITSELVLAFASLIQSNPTLRNAMLNALNTADVSKIIAVNERRKELGKKYDLASRIEKTRKAINSDNLSLLSNQQVSRLYGCAKHYNIEIPGAFEQEYEKRYLHPGKNLTSYELKVHRCKLQSRLRWCKKHGVLISDVLNAALVKFCPSYDPEKQTLRKGGIKGRRKLVITDNGLTLPDTMTSVQKGKVKFTLDNLGKVDSKQIYATEKVLQNHNITIPQDMLDTIAQLQANRKTKEQVYSKKARAKRVLKKAKNSADLPNLSIVRLYNGFKKHGQEIPAELEYAYQKYFLRTDEDLTPDEWVVQQKRLRFLLWKHKKAGTKIPEILHTALIKFCPQYDAKTHSLPDGRGRKQSVDKVDKYANMSDTDLKKVFYTTFRATRGKIDNNLNNAMSARFSKTYNADKRDFNKTIPAVKKNQPVTPDNNITKLVVRRAASAPVIIKPEPAAAVADIITLSVTTKQTKLEMGQAAYYNVYVNDEPLIKNVINPDWQKPLNIQTLFDGALLVIHGICNNDKSIPVDVRRILVFKTNLEQIRQMRHGVVKEYNIYPTAVNIGTDVVNLTMSDKTRVLLERAKYQNTLKNHFVIESKADNHL